MSLISKRKPKLTSSKFPEHKFRQNTPLPIKKNQKKKKLRKLPKFSVGKPALKKRDENSHFHCWEKLQISPLSHGTFLHIFRYTFSTTFLPKKRFGIRKIATSTPFLPPHDSDPHLKTAALVCVHIDSRHAQCNLLLVIRHVLADERKIAINDLKTSKIRV